MTPPFRAHFKADPRPCVRGQHVIGMIAGGISDRAAKRPIGGPRLLSLVLITKSTITEDNTKTRTKRTTVLQSAKTIIVDSGSTLTAQGAQVDCFAVVGLLERAKESERLQESEAWGELQTLCARHKRLVHVIANSHTKGDSPMRGAIQSRTIPLPSPTALHVTSVSSLSHHLSPCTYQQFVRQSAFDNGNKKYVRRRDFASQWF